METMDFKMKIPTLFQHKPRFMLVYYFILKLDWNSIVKKWPGIEIETLFRFRPVEIIRIEKTESIFLTVSTKLKNP